jgi:hypothetical protein
LFRTAELLEMKLPFSIEATEQAVLATVKENELATGCVKLTCYYSEEGLAIICRQQVADMCIVAVDPVTDFGELSKGE